MASRKGLTNARILRLGLGVPNATGFDVRVILLPGLFCWEYKLEIEDMVNCNGNVIKDKTLQNDTDGIN